MRIASLLRSPIVSAADEKRIVDAIRDAERGNRGEVRVHVERKQRGKDAIARARELFGALKMAKTKQGTGVLLYIAVDQRRAAVFAGPGIHARAEEGTWKRVTDAVADGARRGALVDGVVAGVALVGDTLRAHVPGEDVQGDELPNEVTTS